VSHRGVEIDKCSRCQGIWLDVGELAQVTASDERGFLGSLGRIFGG
jgi:Zn-finger nucleic acid-binding protein